MAQALGIHPQTARRRLRRLEELFGDRLADPRFRFEALPALRTHALRANAVWAAVSYQSRALPSRWSRTSET
ncbi:helix-turn-helix domain-containing protein [Streptomyces sp. NPDC048558]|uniref:helix-turn-helix domain-containing protein n=1 Tax=Streptomyces sp. NPDC048558 TaxID=3155759 RepID=UPI0033CC0EE9